MLGLASALAAIDATNVVFPKRRTTKTQPMLRRFDGGRAGVGG